MALTAFTFDGVDSAPFYDPITDNRERPAIVMHSLNGTKYFAAANFVEGDDLEWRGMMLSATVSSLKTKFLNATSGTLACTYGSCTAIITELHVQETPGDVTGYFNRVRIVFQRQTEWA